MTSKTPEAVMAQAALGNDDGDASEWLPIVSEQIAALTAAGFVVVPMEPTEKMCKCAESNWSGFCKGDVTVAAGRLYRAMVEAKPDA